MDFTHMSSDAFEDMCESLCQAEFGAVPIEANPGDGGIDSFRGSLTGDVDHILQYKHFPHGIGESQKKQIRESLNTAVKNYEPKKWTLVVPCNMDESAQKWFEKQKREFAERGVEVDYLGGTTLRNILLKHPTIRAEYFPSTDDQIKVLNAMLGGKGVISEKPKSDVLDLIRSGAEVINDHPDVLFIPTATPEGTNIEIRPRRPGESVTVAKVAFEFPDDPGGRAVRKRWDDMQRKGTPFVVGAEHFTLKESVFDALLGEGDRPSELRMEPLVPENHLPVRLTFVGEQSGKTAELRYVDLRLRRRGTEEVMSDNDKQNSLLRVAMTLNFKEGGGRLTFKTRDYVGRRPSEVVDCEELLGMVATESVRVELEHIETGRHLGAAIVTRDDWDSEPDLSQHEFFQALSLVEQQLDPGLRLPESFTDEDVRVAAHLARILADGCATVEAKLEAEMTMQDLNGALESIEGREAVTYADESVREFALFDKSYVFDVSVTLSAPITLVDKSVEELAENSVVRIQQEGQMTMTFTNGRIKSDA